MDNHMMTEHEDLQISCERLFRIALFGFNREDVAAYLTRMTREHRKEMERYAAALRSAEENSQDNKGKWLEDNEGGQTQAEVLEAQNAALTSENEMLKLRIQELETQNDELPKQGVPELESQTDESLKQDVPELEEKLAATAESAPADTESASENPDAEALQKALEESNNKLALLEDKLRGFELEKNRATTVLEDARAKANQMEAEASAQAAAIINEAKRRIQTLNDTLNMLDGTVNTTSADYFEKLTANQKQFDAMKATTVELRRMIAELQL